MKIFALLALLLVAVNAVTPPTFAGDWVAFTRNELDIAQGDVVKKENEVCCPVGASACKVQTIDEAGETMQSFKYQATRASVQGGYIFTFVKEQRQYAVQALANGTLSCQSSCPLTGQNQAEPIPAAWFINPNSTFVSSGTQYPENKDACGAAGCEVWTYKTTILGIVVMETDTFYTKKNDKTGDYVPVADNALLTPFGEKLGNEATIYSEYTGYPSGLPASDFEFLNKAGCPPPQNGCNQNNGGGGGGGGGNNMYASAANFNVNRRLSGRNWRQYLTVETRAKFMMDLEPLL